MNTNELPQHLRRYIVHQEDRQYTAIDQAVWRFALRQLKAFLSVHGHESYSDGLVETGIRIESIPSISDISKKLSRFGWQALPVSGFIPPAAFMELQALNILPIASDIRSLDHLAYTPAPDIIHEAAGHAPLLVCPEFAQYLRNYAQVAKKAIISSEDMAVYRAIRILSDTKEDPSSTAAQKASAEKELQQAVAAVSHVSEATWLSRMNWWTAEYGLIGSLHDPKILGAGLLSSVGESRHCLEASVKKIPLSIDCIDYSYDITEPQPQLFVARDFQNLNDVLDTLAEKMAFRIGGSKGVERAIHAKTINTVELGSGVQISGLCTEQIKTTNEQVAYLIFQGPSQLSYQQIELPGQGKSYHAHGFGTPVGYFKEFPDICPSKLSDAQWASLGAKPNGTLHLEYTSGVVVTGEFNGRIEKSGRTVVLSLTDARAHFQGRILFEPTWGTFDLAIGAQVRSVFGGPADRVNYGETDDFEARRVPAPKYSASEIHRQTLYGQVRSLRENKKYDDATIEKKCSQVFQDVMGLEHPEKDWLIVLELYEIIARKMPQHEVTKKIKSWLKNESRSNTMIEDGLILAETI